MVGPRFVPPAGFFDESGVLPRVTSAGVREIRRGDDEYPQLVEQSSRPPERFFVIGDDLRDLTPMVCVVGARSATDYGLHCARSIARELAMHGVTIVSGLARGADAAAHDGALSARGKTIGAVATGVDICYPRSSSPVFAEILSGRGSIISLNPAGMDVVFKGEFIQRNRLMVALCSTVLVVQGGIRSAAVGTGLRALEENRTVFAIPGPIDSAACAGTNALLKHSNAFACTGADDILKAIMDDYKNADPAANPIPSTLSDVQRRILEILGNGPTSRETIAITSGFEVTATSRALASLEVDGFIAVINDVVRRVR